MDIASLVMALNNPQPQATAANDPTTEGPIRAARQIGKHANWKKFEAGARPSTNIEDNRVRPEDSLPIPLWLQSGIAYK